jgi:LysR family hydrogen peroxide-inducible transcriptional activator
MAETGDGFEIARRDLEIRGPGEFLGARQSGAPLLRFADLATDTHLLEPGARDRAAAAGSPSRIRPAPHVNRWLGGKSGIPEGLEEDPHRMTLTELKYIVAVAREKHFGKAAEACFVSQPTLSVAIKKLEDELEVKLFERSANEVSVTPLGEEIVRQAQSVLEQAAAIKEIAKRGKDPLAGPLKLGVIYTIGPYLLPDLVRQAIARTPQMPLMLQENFTVKLLEMLRTGEIDCAIMAEPFPDTGLAIAPLYDEPFLAAVPTTHAFADRKTITSEELKSETMLLLGTGHCFRDHVLEVCPEFARFSSDAEGIRKSFEGSSLETIKHMVAAGMGVTLVPRLSVPKDALAAPQAQAPQRRPGLRASTSPSTATRPAAAWCWPGAAASPATRPSPPCATPSTPASCRASSGCHERNMQDPQIPLYQPGILEGVPRVARYVLFTSARPASMPRHQGGAGAPGAAGQRQRRRGRHRPLRW